MDEQPLQNDDHRLVSPRLPRDILSQIFYYLDVKDWTNIAQVDSHSYYEITRHEDYEAKGYQGLWRHLDRQHDLASTADPVQSDGGQSVFPGLDRARTVFHALRKQDRDT
jgi:hypothetical protein